MTLTDGLEFALGRIADLATSIGLRTLFFELCEILFELLLTGVEVKITLSLDLLDPSTFYWTDTLAD